MAITTLQAARDGALPKIIMCKQLPTVPATERRGTLFNRPYLPPQSDASTPTASLNGSALDSTRVGRLPVPNAGAGDETRLLSWEIGGFFLSNSGAGARVELCDRLWENASGSGSGFDITSTSLQSITTPTWPARDRNGSTNGDGVFIALEIFSSMNSAFNTASITLDYTNSAGVGSRTATIPTTPRAIFLDRMYPFILQAGDVGVRSIQGITLGASLVSGGCRLIAYRPICAISAESTEQLRQMDALSLGFPKIYDESVLFLSFLPRNANSSYLTGAIQFTQG